MKMLSIRLAVGGMLWNNREPSKDINFGLFYSWNYYNHLGYFFHLNIWQNAFIELRNNTQQRLCYVLWICNENKPQIGASVR
jgi:hypothetical protein